MSEQLRLPLPVPVALGSENYAVGACNAAAVSLLQRWPRWPHHAVLLIGPPRSGKSHLAAAFAQRTHGRVISAGQLHARIKAPVLVLDEAGPGIDEEGLLHCYNWVKEAGSHLLILASSPPRSWPVRLPDLASRLAATPHLEIGQPDEALIGTLLVKHFRDRGLQVGPEVVAYLQLRLERSFAAAHDAVVALDNAALAQGRPITVALAGTVLKSMMAAQ